MSNRVILIFGIEQPPSVAPSHYFWLYLIEEQRVIDRVFSDQGAAVEWAGKNDVSIVDDWVRDDFVALEDVVAGSIENGAYVVCITVYRNGRPVPNDHLLDLPARRDTYCDTEDIRRGARLD
jgi:hypothetical protein